MLNRQPQQQGSRCQEFFATIPVTTLAVIVVCSVLYVYDAVADADFNSSYAVSAYEVVDLGKWWLPFTASFLHQGLLHVGMNMFSFLYLGRQLEHHMGSLCLLGLIFLFCATNGALYVLFQRVWEDLRVSAVTGSFPDFIAFGLCSSLQHDYSWYQRAVGFSGVIFSVLMVETGVDSAIDPTRMRPVFGMIRVPAWLYPWVLLVLLQLIMPGISFAGHLSGMVRLVYSRCCWCCCSMSLRCARFPASFTPRACSIG